MKSYSERLQSVIPGGAHTYSRGDDQYPENAPQVLLKGKGAYVYDNDGNEFLDYGMALRAVNIGYSEPAINQAALQQIEYGNNLTRPSTIELEAAELLVDLIDSADMVKFTKNGSTAVTAAIKLAKAYTGREIIARCADHPFFSYDDWFIGSTAITRGIDNDIISKTKMFNYNDIESLERLISDNPGSIACVILEPSTIEHPKNNFLHKVKELCKKNGIVFILDEMITGFRWHLKGAQHYYGIEADLCTFGKAMANGFSVAAIAGKKDIMKLGSIDTIGEERVFLLSTTHGAEMSGLGAFVETIKFIKEHDVIDHLWEYGSKLIDLINKKAKEFGVGKNLIAGGIPCSPYYLTFDDKGVSSLGLRTLFSQEMIRNGILAPWLAISYRHGKKELELTEKALDKALQVFSKAVNEGYEKYLTGAVIKPVFRKYN